MKLARIRPAAPGETVVITGASTGMGRDASLFLNELGYRVVAGVRREEDGAHVRDEARRPDELHPVIMDVTDADQIAAAVATVRALLPPDRGVRALFSNAGMASFDRDVSCEGQPDEKLERVVDVDFLGGVRFIRAFLPLVRQERGTVVINSAMMTKVLIPFNGGYAASKSALEAWARSLRREVAPHGVRVVVIRPGAVATAMASRQQPELVPDDSLYPEQRVVVSRFMDGMARHADDPRCSPRRVSELVARVIGTDRPRSHYSVGGGRHVLGLVGSLPEPIQARLVARVLTHA